MNETETVKVDRLNFLHNLENVISVMLAEKKLLTQNPTEQVFHEAFEHVREVLEKAAIEKAKNLSTPVFVFVPDFTHFDFYNSETSRLLENLKVLTDDGFIFGHTQTETSSTTKNHSEEPTWVSYEADFVCTSRNPHIKEQPAYKPLNGSVKVFVDKKLKQSLQILFHRYAVTWLKYYNQTEAEIYGWDRNSNRYTKRLANLNELEHHMEELHTNSEVTVRVEKNVHDTVVYKTEREEKVPTPLRAILEPYINETRPRFFNEKFENKNGGR